MHTDTPSVIAKVWLIGRAYAAAIERRRNKSNQNDDFYVQVVGPRIIRSEIDSWIKACQQWNGPSNDSLATLLEVHNRTTQLFRDISDLEKRSLASKYLHFHVPNLFYIYDARAVAALRELSSVVGRAGRAGRAGLQADNEYRKFAEKCLALQQRIESALGIRLTPREIDNLLLFVHAVKQANPAIKRDVPTAAPRSLLERFAS
ncbi:MAG: hypothetical protein Q8O33_10045 [Pseudomonadota bacterium]|nr:hypothetical protein [Pseudomonadota bacterium]